MPKQSEPCSTEITKNARTEMLTSFQMPNAARMLHTNKKKEQSLKCVLFVDVWSRATSWKRPY